MAAGFDWSPHAHRQALAVPVPIPNRYDGKLGAANNELLHPVVERLFSRFLSEFAPENIRHYPDHQPIVSKVSQHFQLPADRILLTAGSDAAIQILLAAVAGASGCLLLQWPNYKGYETYANLCGIEFEPIRTLGLPPEEAEARLAARMEKAPAGLVVITNPSTIDGSYLPVEALHRLAEIARARGHLLLIDEAYIGFFDLDHTPLLGRFPNVAILRSFSKTMGLAGLRIGALLSGDAWLTNYLRRWSPGNPVSVVATAFLGYCLDHLTEIEEARAEIVTCREWIRKRAKMLLPDWRIPVSAANFVFLQSPDAAANTMMVRAFDDAGIAVRDISRLDAATHAVRITVGHKPVSERIIDVLERFAAVAA